MVSLAVPEGLLSQDTQSKARLTNNYKVRKSFHIALLEFVHNVQVFALDLWFIGNREFLNRLGKIAIRLLLFLLRSGPWMS
jgi:hypothetical protein